MKQLLCLVFLCASAIAAEQSPIISKDAIRGYEIICFCNSPGVGPEQIIRLDNNGQILLAARAGITRKQLKDAGVPYAESQLQLLMEWNFLEERDRKFTTAIPMLDRREMEGLRGEVRKAAQDSLPDLQAGIARFLQQLREIRREKSAFTILFSYVLDDLVWDDFQRQKQLASRQALTAEHPFWSGLVWATASPRAFAPGTNAYGGHGVALYVNWTHAAMGKLGPFMSGAGLAAIFGQLEKNGKIADPAVLKAFAPYGIADANGNFTVPVIVRRSTDPLYGGARALAASVARSALEHLPLAAIQQRYRLTSREQALVIAYHEFMWELLELLSEEHLVDKPAVLVAPDKAKLFDVGDLVFIVRDAP